jgi:hypothetical protein
MQSDMSSAPVHHPLVGGLIRWLAWLACRKVELSVFLLGVALRLSMRFAYEPTDAYDFDSHWELVQWMIEHRRVALPAELFQAQHPPVFYTIAALLFANGVSIPQLAWLPVTCGVIRLGLTWAALELYLPHSRWARVSALALAATMAASVHVDGMIYTECINCLLASIAIVLAPLAFRRRPWQRLRIALLMGLVLGVEMLTKISAASVLLAVCGVGALEFAFSRVALRERWRGAVCWVAMIATCVGVCGWYFARNVTEYGRPFVTVFELNSSQMVRQSNAIPYLQRRPLGYVFGWEPAMYAFPFAHSCTGENPTFFPAAVASTFVDYWNYGFSRIATVGKTGIHHPAASTPPDILLAAQRAAVGGTLIFLAIVVAWLGASLHVWQRRDWGRMTLVAVPLAALAAAMHFAITYPVDAVGVVKSVYMQFGAGPLCGLYGVSVGWSRERIHRWPLLPILLGALWLVAAYTLYCRFRIPILPLG